MRGKWKRPRLEFGASRLDLTIPMKELATGYSWDGQQSGQRLLGSVMSDTNVLSRQTQETGRLLMAVTFELFQHEDHPQASG